MMSAFASNAFQPNAFQSAAADPGFQFEAFQADAFQVDALAPSPPVTIIVGGHRGWFERRKDAVAYGDVLSVCARLIVGQASTTSVLAGNAAGNGVAKGGHLKVATQILPGTATGERSYSDDELLMIFAEAA